MTASGRNACTIRRTCKKLFTSLKGKPIFFIKELLLKPAISIPFISYPACGTFSISILPTAPTNNISLAGFIFFNALAMAMAGKICPPVPPPAIIIRCAALPRPGPVGREWENTFALSFIWFFICAVFLGYYFCFFKFFFLIILVQINILRYRFGYFLSFELLY